MTTILLLKDLYKQAFVNFKSMQVAVLKLMTWFVFSTMFMGVVVFIYKVSSGFFVI